MKRAGTFVGVFAVLALRGLPSAAAPEAALKSTGYRGSYFMNGEIHVNEYGTPEGKPLTSGHQDFKPSWSKTGDMLVFFRLSLHAVAPWDSVNWLDISPDGEWLIYSQSDPAQSDIMLVENFR